MDDSLLLYTFICLKQLCASFCMGLINGAELKKYKFSVKGHVHGGNNKLGETR